jgi:cbb3-type cytochrome oxidase subunit 1
MTTTFIRFLNIILVALLAGTSFGIWIGFNPIDYSASTYVEQQQHLVTSLNTLMVALVIVATLVTVASAILHRQNKTVFYTLIFAAAFLASCIFISRLGNLPIQTEMLSWNSTSLPVNWTDMRDRWWTFHIMRTIAELIALLLVAWTSALRKEKH